LTGEVDRVAKADRVDELESRIEGLTRALQRVEDRLERLETSAPRGAAGPGAALASGSLEAEEPPLMDLPPLPEPQGILALAGRMTIALGGGYLIRALTDAGVVPPLSGVGLGLAYALGWLLLADRTAAGGARVSAGFHALTAGLVAYPLLVEATARFHLLGPAPAFALLVGFCAAGLVVARRRDMAAVAWGGTGLALGAAAALLIATRHLLGGALALLAIAACVEWLAVQDRWTGLRWPAALMLDLAVLDLILLATRPEGLPEGYPPLSAGSALAVVLALPAVYLPALLVRTLARERPVTAFELIQTPVAILLGFSCASSLLAGVGSSTAPIGVLSLLLGALTYAAAFAFVERRPHHDRNFYFYSAAGGILTLVGTGQILSAAPRSVAWSLLGIAAALLGRRFGRMTLRFHGALYVAAAAIGSGLTAAARRAFAGPASGEWAFPSGAALFAAASVAAVCVALAAGRAGAEPWWRRTANGIAAFTLTWVGGGLLVVALVTLARPFAPGAAAVATVRTAVLSFLIVALAWTSRRRALPELGWFVYPLLAFGALKLVSEDLSQGNAASLCLSLVFYGGALIGGPRLLRGKA
jgi:hypothetical protein